MNADEMVAYALEAPPELLPFLPELLADLDELGSDAEQIAHVLRNLRLPPTARVVDLGCGKGATAIEIASVLRLTVLGIELFEPFVAKATAAAQAAGVSHLCEFRHGDVRTVPDGMMLVDVAVFAALGAVLGHPAETMGVLRQYIRPGGHILVADVFLRDGGAVTFPGFEHYRLRAETVGGLTAWGDVLVTDCWRATMSVTPTVETPISPPSTDGPWNSPRDTPTTASSSWPLPPTKPRRTSTLLRTSWMPSGCCVGQPHSRLITPGVARPARARAGRPEPREP